MGVTLGVKGYLSGMLNRMAHSFPLRNSTATQMHSREEEQVVRESTIDIGQRNL